jgi:hypothetical protein
VQVTLAGTEVPPALSPCHALSNWTSFAANESVGKPTSPPRLGTSCQMTPLAVAMSLGLRSTKLAT